MTAVAACTFCEIARGAADAYVICRDELVIAFLDLHPIRPAHVLVVSVEHHAYFEDLPAATSARVMHVGQLLAGIMKRTYGVPRVAFVFTGDQIAHAHAHVVPMVDDTDVTSRRYIVEAHVTFAPAPAARAADLAATAARLRAALDSRGRRDSALC